MGNRETRVKQEYVHLYLGFDRTGTNKDHRCIRHVIRDDAKDLVIFESKLRAIGGEWRIHKTVNARCPQQALKNLQHKLIDHPECASTIDTEWRTALLQSNCIYGDKHFMLDVDFRDSDKKAQLDLVIMESNGVVLAMIKSPKGWHYITEPFDTREVLKTFDEEPFKVDLIRDGYYYVKTVGEKPDWEYITYS